jgi:hypothetical protein
MLDILLQNHPGFLAKIRTTFKEGDVFPGLVDYYIDENDIKTLPIATDSDATFSTNFNYNGDEYETTFSNNLNFIIAKSINPAEDNYRKAYIYIFNHIGSSKMNCYVVDYDDVNCPTNYIPQGMGSIEYSFCNSENSIVHQISYGTWRKFKDDEAHEQKLLNIFPVTLDENYPSIKINFVEKDNVKNFSIIFNSGHSRDEDFTIDICIDNEFIKLNIESKKFVDELKLLFLKNIHSNVIDLFEDCISDWLSQSFNRDEFYESLKDKIAHISISDTSRFRLLPLDIDSLNFPSLLPLPQRIEQEVSLKPHPSIEELDEIEKTHDGESRVRSNPNCPATKVSKLTDGKKNSNGWIRDSSKNGLGIEINKVL